MKASFKKFPIDVILCLLLSILLLPIVLLDLNGPLRIILCLPFILFIPGYVLIFGLFPSKKTDKGIDKIERIALSFGLSIAIVPLIGLGLNYTRWGIRLQPILFSLFLFIFIAGIIGIYRWRSLKQEQRFFISFDLSFPKSENRLDKALTIIIIASIIIAVVSLVYVIIVPKQGEKFTEFYILGPNGLSDDYPNRLSLDENATGIIGIVNHEYQTINYTIEVWLIDQSIVYNEENDENQTVYDHMWFLDKTEISLDNFQLDVESDWSSRWENNFSYNMDKNGLYKLAFILFTEPTIEYDHNTNYNEITEDKLNNAYREIHLWIEVASSQFYMLDSDGLEETFSRNITQGENVTGFVGIVNNEFKIINYTVDIWLINQTTMFDENLGENVTTIHNMWYMDLLTMMLNHTKNLTQWVENYTINIDKAGSYQLAFLMFSIPTERYFIGEDYKQRAEIIFDNVEKELSIVVNVT